MGDLYAILGLSDLTYEAKESDIKQAYIRMALQFHPDKIGEGITQSDKDIWLQVQNAYETLSDKDKRRRYDSSLPFDDSIPSEDSVDITDANFFEVFEPAFRRNIRFAKKKPFAMVGELGDLTTPMELVYRFYKYWDNFETWREFSQYDEYDIREAADRYERRYMEKENKKIRDKYTKKERARIIKLVELAYKFDPRIKYQKLLEEQERQRVKQEKREKKETMRKEQEEKLRQEEDVKQKEIERLQEEERRQKEEKDAQLKKRKEAVKELIALCENTQYDRFFIEEFCKKIRSAEDIEELNGAIRASQDCERTMKEHIKRQEEKDEEMR